MKAEMNKSGNYGKDGSERRDEKMKTQFKICIEENFQEN